MDNELNVEQIGTDPSIMDKNEKDEVNLQSGDESSSDEFEQYTFSTKSSESGLALVLEGKKLYVSKDVLALVSPVFKAMFSSEYKEKSSDEIPLPGKNHDDVLEFLRCIYPNLRKPISLTNVFRVLPLAHEYQVSVIIKSCIKFLKKCLTDDIPAPQLYNILMQASVYQLDEVKEKCLKLAADRPHTELNDVGPDTISDEMSTIVRAKMLDNLETKHHNASKQVHTSKALSTFLGASAKQKDIANHYKAGRLVGDYKSLSVSNEQPTPVNLNVDGIQLTVFIELRTYHRAGLGITYCMEGQHDVTLFGAVVVNNWMKDKDDIIKTVKQNIEKSSSDTKRQFASIRTEEIENETLGFKYNGCFNIDICMFIIKDE